MQFTGKAGVRTREIEHSLTALEDISSKTVALAVSETVS